MTKFKGDFSYIKAYLFLGVGVFCSITVLVYLDVQLSLSKIEANNSKSWTNMNPQIRYYFIPFIFVPIFIISSILTYICEKFHQTKVYKNWFLQGLGFGLVVSVFPLARLIFSFESAVIISLVLTFLFVALIRKGERYEKNL